jgi:hypothetical protein
MSREPLKISLAGIRYRIQHSSWVGVGCPNTLWRDYLFTINRLVKPIYTAITLKFHHLSNSENSVGYYSR